MPQQLIVTIPTTDAALRRQVEQGLEEYADVRQSQAYTDPETVKLVLDMVAQGWRSPAAPPASSPFCGPRRGYVYTPIYSSPDP